MNTSFLPRVLATLLGLFFLTGCGSTPAPKTADPAQIEQKRQAHEQQMQKEMNGS